MARPVDPVSEQGTVGAPWGPSDKSRDASFVKTLEQNHLRLISASFSKFPSHIFHGYKTLSWSIQGLIKF